MTVHREKEQAAKQAQLNEKTEVYVKEAKGIVESLITRGVAVGSLRSAKDIERERTKCTKAKRKLKVQVSSAATCVLPCHHTHA
jgi:hypothetical protein